MLGLENVIWNIPLFVIITEKPTLYFSCCWSCTCHHRIWRKILFPSTGLNWSAFLSTLAQISHLWCTFPPFCFKDNFYLFQTLEFFTGFHPHIRMFNLPNSINLLLSHVMWLLQPLFKYHKFSSFSTWVKRSQASFFLFRTRCVNGSGLGRYGLFRSELV